MKGLRAESARAVTGSEEGEDFLTGQPDFFYGNSCNFGTESRKIDPKVRGKTFWRVSRIFFTETAVTSERKVEKSFPRWEINRHVEG